MYNSNSYGVLRCINKLPWSEKKDTVISWIEGVDFDRIIFSAKRNKYVLWCTIMINNTLQTVVVMIVWLNLQLPMQSVPIATYAMSSNPAHGEMYSIQQYVIKFASALRQGSGFLRVLRFPPAMKLTITI